MTSVPKGVTGVAAADWLSLVLDQVRLHREATDAGYPDSEKFESHEEFQRACRDHSFAGGFLAIDLMNALRSVAALRGYALEGHPLADRVRLLFENISRARGTFENPQSERQTEEAWSLTKDGYVLASLVPRYLEAEESRINETRVSEEAPVAGADALGVVSDFSDVQASMASIGSALVPVVEVVRDAMMRSQENGLALLESVMRSMMSDVPEPMVSCAREVMRLVVSDEGRARGGTVRVDLPSGRSILVIVGREPAGRTGDSSV